MSFNSLPKISAAIAISTTLLLVGAEASAATPSSTNTHATDLSSARRHHRAVRTSVRSAFGAYSEDAGAVRSQPSYGYGVGDNSRNQTW